MMITKEIDEKLGVLFQDDGFTEALSEIKTMDELLKFLDQNGVQMTEEDVHECMKQGRQMLKEQNIMNEDGELTEAGLEMVAGGFSKKRFFMGLAIVAAGACCGNPAAVALGAVVVIWSFYSSDDRLR